MRFHPYSGVTTLVQGIDYAAMYDHDRSYLPVGVMPRPVKLVMGPLDLPMIIDPMAEPETMVIEPSGQDEVLVLGLWTDKVYADNPGGDWTWQQYAAHQLGQVLRQRDLAQRLSDFGIAREPEAYLSHRNTGNAVQRSLTLNYDELDKLLRAAGF